MKGVIMYEYKIDDALDFIQYEQNREDKETEAYRIYDFIIKVLKEAKERNNDPLSTTVKKLESENDRLKRILRIADEELTNRIGDLCELTQFESEFSPCSICAHLSECESYNVENARWVHSDAVEKLIGDYNEV